MTEFELEHERVYADYSEITLDESTYMTELTWLEENDYGFIPRHYFIDYPGIRSIEREISNVVGGTPLVRYSLPVVLQTFVTATNNKRVLFTSLDKARHFVKTLNDLNIKHTIIYSLFTSDEIYDDIHAARKRAAEMFGNAL